MCADHRTIGRHFFCERLLTLNRVAIRSQALLDLFRLRFGPDKRQQEIVRIADVAQPAVVRVLGIAKRQTP
jgi:hypothetical protein